MPDKMPLETRLELLDVLDYEHLEEIVSESIINVWAQYDDTDAPAPFLNHVFNVEWNESKIDLTEFYVYEMLTRHYSEEREQRCQRLWHILTYYYSHLAKLEHEKLFSDIKNEFSEIIRYDYGWD